MFILKPNYPNPFNPETIISFGLPKDSEVQIFVFNVLGQKVRTLVKGHYQIGWHNITWGGRDNKGELVDSDLYILQLKTEYFEATHKMIWLR